MERGTRLTFTIAVFCLAQSLAQIGAMAFAALLPAFFAEWSLSHAEAGWLSGIMFGAYAAAVPILLPLTDRIEARKVYLCAVSTTMLSHLGMAFFADGFWTALVFRALNGIGWAGTYMVGLKALSDQVEGPAQSRAVAVHGASTGISSSFSFVIAGVAAAHFGWQAAFMVGAGGAFGALLVAVTLFPAGPRRERPAATVRLVDLKPVLRNASVMAYALGYCAHTWEMFVMRSWVVTFLTFAAAQGGGAPNFLVPTMVATLASLLGTVSSVLGNEMARRMGRKRWILLVFAASMALALLVGFTAGMGYGAAATVCLLYNAAIYADSSSLTAGTVGNADPERRGAALTVHAMLGYGGGFVGPLAMGLILHVLGGESVFNWGIGFGHIAVVLLVGPLAIRILKPRDLPGDRPGAD
ncbi:MAG: MFS transporter [Deltaproteobacteria bacterium]|nr:MFS transporter [Deltaproteobacteria bacterium]